MSFSVERTSMEALCSSSAREYSINNRVYLPEEIVCIYVLGGSFTYLNVDMYCCLAPSGVAVCDITSRGVRGWRGGRGGEG